MLNNIIKNENTGQISVVRTEKSRASFLPRPIRAVYPEHDFSLPDKSSCYTPTQEDTNFKKKSKSFFNDRESKTTRHHIPGTLLGGRRVFHSSVDVSRISSRIGSFDNISHQPQDNDIKIFHEKPTYTHVGPTIATQSKAFTLKTSPDEKEKVFHQKLDYSHVTPLVPYRDNELHSPGGGNVNIPNQKLNFRETAKPKIEARSSYQTKLSEISIPIHKLRFRDSAATRIDSRRNLGLQEIPKNTRHLIDLLTVSLPDLRKEVGELQVSKYHPDHLNIPSIPPSQLGCEETETNPGEPKDNEL